MTDPAQTYSVYRLTCRETGKAYVGVTRKRPEERWREHADAASRGATTLLHRAIRKYGFDSFDREVLRTEEGSSEAMFAAEVGCIAQYGTLVPGGYNLTRGGEGTPGHKMSPEGKARLSALRTGTKASTKTRAKMSRTRKGRPLPDSVRKALSESQLGAKNHRYGKTHTGEWKASRRDENSGEGNPFHGRQHTDESKARMSAATKARNLTGSRNPSARSAVVRGVTYPTMKGAVEALGLRGYGELYRLLSDTDSGVALAEKNQ